LGKNHDHSSKGARDGWRPDRPGHDAATVGSRAVVVGNVGGAEEGVLQGSMAGHACVANDDGMMPGKDTSVSRSMTKNERKKHTPPL